jgi:hypothetical protein
MKVLIINFNRLTLPSRMADWLADHGCEPIFIDNASTYEPLKEYYLRCPYRVVEMYQNFGHTVIWTQDIVNKLGIKDRYIVTDSDLDLSFVPDDFLKVLNKGLDLYPQFDKCGLSLEIEDLPDSVEGNFIRKIETKYWNKPLDKRYFDAPVDTTFALYWVNRYTLSGIRANRPYTARHLPWYYTNFDLLPEDERNYFLTANDSSSGKKRILP